MMVGETLFSPTDVLCGAVGIIREGCLVHLVAPVSLDYLFLITTYTQRTFLNGDGVLIKQVEGTDARVAFACCRFFKEK